MVGAAVLHGSLTSRGEESQAGDVGEGAGRSGREKRTCETREGEWGREIPSSCWFGVHQYVKIAVRGAR